MTEELERQFLHDLSSNRIFSWTKGDKLGASKDNQNQINQSLSKYHSLFTKYNIECFTVEGDGRLKEVKAKVHTLFDNCEELARLIKEQADDGVNVNNSNNNSDNDERNSESEEEQEEQQEQVQEEQESRVVVKQEGRVKRPTFGTARVSGGGVDEENRRLSDENSLLREENLQLREEIRQLKEQLSRLTLHGTEHFADDEGDH